MFARYVHLDTHGSCAHLKSQVQPEGGLELAAWRSTIYGQNPLTLSGVVLAGANLPQVTEIWKIEP